MKTRSTAPTRPRSSGGVSSGPSVERMNMLSMSAAARRGERDEREHVAAREREDDREGAERGDRQEQLRADAPLDRADGEHERDHHRAGAGRGAQQAVAERADVQDVLREDGQQRGRTAEQHRHQVQRHRAEQRRLARMKRTPASASRSVGDGARRRGAPRRSPRHGEHAGGARPRGDRRDMNGAGAPSVQQPAMAGPTIVPTATPSVHRHHARQLLGRGARGEHRREGGRRVRLADADEQGEQVQGPERLSPAAVSKAMRGGRERDHREAEDRHAAAVAVVGGVPGGQREEQRRQELREADQAEHEGRRCGGTLPPQGGLHPTPTRW